MKFGMSLRYTFGRFVFKFHKVLIDDDVIVTSFIFGTNIQQHKVHLIVKVQMTLTDAEGQRSQIVISDKVLHPHTSYLVPMYNTISDN